MMISDEILDCYISDISAFKGAWDDAGMKVFCELLFCYDTAGLYVKFHFAHQL